MNEKPYSMPSPSNATMDDSSVDLMHLRAQLWGRLSVGIYSISSIQNIRRGLDSLSRETLVLLNDALMLKYRSSAALSRWVIRHAPASENSPDEIFLRELLVYSKSFNSATNSDYVHLLIGAIRSYDQLPKMADYSQADTDTMTVIHGILSITDYLYADWFEDDCDSVPMYLDDDLADVIFENLDKIESIKELVRKRESTDADMIRAVFKNESTALYDGAL